MCPDPDSWNELAWFYPDGRTEPIYRATNAIGTLRLSPDGAHVAYSTRNPSAGIWALDVDRKTTIRITPTEGDEFPVWSPDGKRIAFSMVRGGESSIGWAPADGSVPPEVLYADPAGRPCFPTGFSPDGKELLIAVVTAPAGDTDIFVVNTPAVRPQALYHERRPRRRPVQPRRQADFLLVGRDGPLRNIRSRLPRSFVEDPHLARRQRSKSRPTATGPRSTSRTTTA